MTTTIPDEILEIDDHVEAALIIYAWSEPEIGADVVLHLTCLATGLGEGEDDVRAAVTLMIAEIAAWQLWRNDPLAAIYEHVGRHESPTLAEHAGQFAAERFRKAREIASLLVASTRMRAAV